VDELARWAETVGRDGGPRDWAPVDDPAVIDEFVRVHAEKLGRPCERDLVRIERADDALRVQYSGTALEMTDPAGGPIDLLESVTSAALTLAQIEHDNEYH
jgi:hypothetical protein